MTPLLLLVPEEEDQARGSGDKGKLHEKAAGPILPASAHAAPAVPAAHCLSGAMGQRSVCGRMLGWNVGEVSLG